MRRSVRLLVVVLAILMVIAVPVSAEEVDRPLNASIDGWETGFVPGPAIPEGRCPAEAEWMLLTAGSGQAAQLGLFTYTTEHCSWPVRPTQDGAIGRLDAGLLVMTFRTGDELHIGYSGRWRFAGDLSTGEGKANIRQSYTVLGGTGMFEGAAGSGFMNGVDDFHHVLMRLRGNLIIDS